MQILQASRSLLWLSALALLGAGVATTARHLDRRAPAADLAQPIYLPQAQYLQPMALGWRNALADVLWFRTISYFGQHYRSDRTYPWLAHMCDLVTDLDPRAEHVYRFAGVILPWEANQVDAGIRLLEKGLRQFPESWQLHYHLGFHHYFFKNDNDAALSHLREAMALPGAHPAVARLAAVLATEQYGPETTLAFLDAMRRDVDSGDVREVVVEHMREARLAADLERLRVAVQTYRERTGALPPSLLALVEAGVLDGIPEDPFGGRYELDPGTGAVRSDTGRVPSQLHTSRIRHRALQGESVRDL